ncbi:PREDICTED: F-box protein At1g47810-like [Camelina sativa]|uniref:F-box protein At1g47810-like n=1 Tax=Camelina sativa TaxID=90675 RepID=A0ABM1QBV1_CAMSA|nr:PREDICTED: F-box protein At1g47810-like [Camelina sativa]
MSKKNKQSRDPIPVDVLFEILLRLPAKYVARFLCVSKFWATIIGGREFIRSYSLQTSQQPRLLFAFNNEIKGYQENWYFFSKSTHVSTPLCSCEREPVRPVLRRDARNGRFRQGPGVADLVNKVVAVVEEPPEFLSSTVCHLKKLRYNKPSYVRGLICFLYGEEQVVTNPVTGKSITLPTVKSTEMIVRSFLGYDPIDAQYKVLCLTNVTRFCEHQVLTLGGAQSWRMVH